MTGKLNITVMLGGPSAEREVSLRSGAAVSAALRGRGHEVRELDPSESEWSLPEGTEVVYLALHGAYGEDGTLQAELDGLGVAYTGCDAESSRVAFDKVLMKEAFEKSGVPTPPYSVLTRGSTPDLSTEFKPPVVLKPACQGSSVGLQFVDREDQFKDRLEEALRHGDRIVMEPKVRGREVTVGILGDLVLPVVEIRPKVGSYDYQNKYTVGATEYICPAEFPEELTGRIQAAALDAFRAVNGRDYARVDIMVTVNDQPLVLEVNTLPGMTETSLLPKAAAAAGIGYGELCERMVLLALERGKMEVRL
jgi:D-alanine-D-alanine ligase